MRESYETVELTVRIDRDGEGAWSTKLLDHKGSEVAEMWTRDGGPTMALQALVPFMAVAACEPLTGAADVLQRLHSVTSREAAA